MDDKITAEGLGSKRVLLLAPRPSCPLVVPPQQRRSPMVDTMHVAAIPMLPELALIATREVNEATGIRSQPSWPNEKYPQQRVVPLVVTIRSHF